MSPKEINAKVERLKLEHYEIIRKRELYIKKMELRAHLMSIATDIFVQQVNAPLQLFAAELKNVRYKK